MVKLWVVWEGQWEAAMLLSLPFTTLLYLPGKSHLDIPTSLSNSSPVSQARPMYICPCPALVSYYGGPMSEPFYSRTNHV